MSALVDYKVREGVAFITLNRPEKLNALDAAMSNRMHTLWERFENDPEAKVAILRGAGRAFCAGGDLNTDKGKDLDDRDLPWAMQVHRAYPENGHKIFKPIVGCIHGYALGAGFQLAVKGCDITVAGESALFGYPESKAGVPSTPIEYVPYMPFKVSLEFALLAWKGGRLLDARRAYDLGVVNAVVPDDELEDEALKWAQLLMEIPPLFIRSIKYGHYQAVTTRKTAAERDYMEFVWPQEVSEDRKEARAAFREKRKPSFKGR